MSESQTRWLTTTEAGKILNLHPNTVRKLCHEGVLPAKRYGRTWRISLRGLIEMENVRPDTPHPPSPSSVSTIEVDAYELEAGNGGFRWYDDAPENITAWEKWSEKVTQQADEAGLSPVQWLTREYPGTDVESWRERSIWFIRKRADLSKKKQEEKVS